VGAAFVVVVVYEVVPEGVVVTYVGAGAGIEVVWVVTVVVAGDGGGAETTCESSEAQPAKRASAPQRARAGAKKVARLEGLVFIPTTLTDNSAAGSVLKLE
jgi:hypothetical protein